MVINYILWASLFVVPYSTAVASGAVSGSLLEPLVASTAKSNKYTPAVGVASPPLTLAPPSTQCATAMESVFNGKSICELSKLDKKNEFIAHACDFSTWIRNDASKDNAGVDTGVLKTELLQELKDTDASTDTLCKSFAAPDYGCEFMLTDKAPRFARLIQRFVKTEKSQEENELSSPDARLGDQFLQLGSRLRRHRKHAVLKHEARVTATAAVAVVKKARARVQMCGNNEPGIYKTDYGCCCQNVRTVDQNGDVTEHCVSGGIGSQAGTCDYKPCRRVYDNRVTISGKPRGVCTPAKIAACYA